MARATNEPSPAGRGEVYNEVQRRRRWTFVEKLRAAQEASTPGTSVSSVARKYGMAPSQLFRWRKLIHSQGLEAVLSEGQETVAEEVRELKRQVRELERLLGKKTLENETLREAIELEKSKRQVRSDLLKEEHTF
jgi:transposase